MCKPQKQDLIHLHCHTHFSVQDGLPTPTEYARHAREMGFPATAITDHGRMGGVIEFVEACRNPYKDLAPIKPIIGVEVYTYFDRHVKESVIRADGTKGRPKHNHLTLLAMNEIGYRNLLRIQAIGAEEGYYYEPTVDWEVLEKYNEGIIALSGCLASEVNQALLKGMDDEAEKIAGKFSELYDDRYYIELQYHGIPEQKANLGKLVKIAKNLNVPIVASNDVHYLKPEDWRAHDLLISMRDISSDRVNRGKKEAYGSHQFYLKSEEEMMKIFSSKPEAISNTLALGEKVEDFLKLDVPHLLPHVVVPSNDPEFSLFKSKNLPYHKENEAYLAYLAMKGLNKIGFGSNKEYKARLKYEIEQIWYMGVTDYFLIQSEMVDFMKSKDILYGIRGSGVGSLVNHCLEVCNVDPVKWNLMFERFLNPGRGNQYEISYKEKPSKTYLEEKGKKNQEGAVKRLKKLVEDKVAEDKSLMPHKPDIDKEIWVLEMANLATYICDLADSGLTTEHNDAQLWTAYFFGITNEMPTTGLKVKKVASLPDVDTDIDDSRRSEVIEWARNRFGHDHVSMIGTWGTYQIKAAVTNTLKVSEQFNNDWGTNTHKMSQVVSKSIPIRPQAAGKSKNPVADAIAESPDFAKWAKKYPEDIKLAEGLIDRISNLGIHAGGVLVSSEPIRDHSPIENSKGVLASAYDMKSVERVGLVKYDYLGLACFQMIALAQKMITKRHGKPVDFSTIDITDQNVFNLYKAAKTSTVFQFASEGMQQAIAQVSPSTIEDLIAVVALYRPGPMAFIPDYAEGKRHPEKIKYAHPIIKKHLEVTYGIMVYQEQAMFLAREMASLDWDEVDKLRKAVSKKDPEAFGKICKIFESKALEKNIPKQAVDATLNLMGKFAGYAFNRSHACAYAILSYYTAYLRTYYPAEWLAAVIQIDRDDEKKMAAYARECRGQITILKPNVNDSGLETTVTNSGAIALPLTSIKGVGAMAQTIVQHQPFESLKDMIWRARPNRGMVEHLAEGGALQCLDDAKKKSVEDIMIYCDELVSERNESDKRKKREEKMKYKTLSPLSAIQGTDVVNHQLEERKVKPRKETKIKNLNTRSLFPNDIF
jgi:DNA polymerase III alpha subunit